MERIGIVVTVRAELAIIEEFIQYHLSKNIDEIFIFKAVKLMIIELFNSDHLYLLLLIFQNG